MSERTVSREPVPTQGTQRPPDTAPQAERPAQRPDLHDTPHLPPSALGDWAAI